MESLIPDLANFVFEYCWPVEKTRYDVCLYGDYEELRDILITVGPLHPPFTPFTPFMGNVQMPRSALSAVRYHTPSVHPVPVSIGTSNTTYAYVGGFSSDVRLVAKPYYKTDISGVCIGGYVKMVELIVNTQNKAQISPGLSCGISHACKARHRDVVEFLMKRGADKCFCYDEKHCLYQELWNVKSEILNCLKSFMPMF